MKYKLKRGIGKQEESENRQGIFEVLKDTGENSIMSDI